jgi:hypothetical protein
MPITREAARAAWVAANPFPVMVDDNGLTRPSIQAEYDAMADEKAGYWQEADAQRDLTALLLARRAQVRTALTQLALGRQKLAVTNADRQGFLQLPAWGAATQAQKAEILRVVCDELLQDLAGTITVLVDLALIEREEAGPQGPTGATGPTGL